MARILSKVQVDRVENLLDLQFSESLPSLVSSLLQRVQYSFFVLLLIVLLFPPLPLFYPFSFHYELPH